MKKFSRITMLVMGGLVMAPGLWAQQDKFSPSSDESQDFSGVRPQVSDCWFFGRAVDDPMCKAEPTKVTQAPAQVAPPIALDSGALFDLNSHELKPNSARKVKDMASKIKTDKPEVKSIEVTGYADPTGSVAFNEELSALRAETVKKVLVEEGIKSSAIRTSGAGASDAVVPLSECDNLKGESLAGCLAPNRRIEVNAL